MEPGAIFYLVDSQQAGGRLEAALQYLPRTHRWDPNIVVAESPELGRQIAEFLRFEESTRQGNSLVFYDLRGQ